MANTASNATAAKPKVGGAVSVAPSGTTLPTDATTALAADYTSLGYIAEDGVTNSNTGENATVKAWGGDIVVSSQTGKPDTFKFKLLEALNADVLEEIYGSSNVTGTLATGLTVKATADQPAERVWVIETVLKNSAVKRVVIPKGTITAMDDIVYKDSEAVGYGITITATPDSTGVTHYEYIKSA